MSFEIPAPRCKQVGLCGLITGNIVTHSRSLMQAFILSWAEVPNDVAREG